MRRTTFTLTRMGIGAIIGFLTLGGWALLGLSVLGSVFGGSVEPLLIVVAIPVILAGPVLLGRSNRAGWLRVFVVALVAPLLAGAGFLPLLLLFRLMEAVIGIVPSDLTPLLLASFVVGLAGFTHLLTQRATVEATITALGGMATAFAALLLIEVIARLASVPTERGAADGVVTWGKIAAYTVAAGLNVIYFELWWAERESVRGTPTVFFLLTNLVVLLVTVFLGA